MGKRSIVLLSAAALLLLAGCASGGGSSSEGETTYKPPKEEEAKVKGGFDAPLALPDGTSFTLSSPASFTPGKFASGQIKGQKYLDFKISVTNGGKSPLDLSTLIVTGVTPAGNCADIFDGDNNVNGAPQEPLAVGKSIEVNWALSCPGATGAKLDVSLQNNGSNLIQASGKLS